MSQDNTELVQFHSFKEDCSNSVLLTGYKLNQNTNLKICLWSVLLTQVNIQLKYKLCSIKSSNKIEC